MRAWKFCLIFLREKCSLWWRNIIFILISIYELNWLHTLNCCWVELWTFLWFPSNMCFSTTKATCIGSRSNNHEKCWFVFSIFKCRSIIYIDYISSICSEDDISFGSTKTHSRYSFSRQTYFRQNFWCSGIWNKNSSIFPKCYELKMNIFVLCIV